MLIQNFQILINIWLPVNINTIHYLRLCAPLTLVYNFPEEFNYTYIAFVCLTYEVSVTVLDQKR